ncbi:hemerythrin domain-containing protein [Phenylobacterium sp.]|uniref:hemerythrin domain-containing protein n=1 Tax=Phenylobacterium sp. TaxID=1871053 RepID=UPI0025E28CB3|nr:hemerythrin domain-containing protein [Phenylobacterium sp.]
MATTQSQSSKSPLTKDGRASARPNDAVSDLMADHRTVEDLFKQYEKSKSDDAKKQSIAQQIIAELRVHMVLEEEIFYPESRPFVDEQDTVNEAEVEHASAKDLMKQIEAMSPSDDYYDAKVKVLSEMIDHHVEEEETEYFPEVRRSDMDLKAVGEKMRTRKAELKTRPN